MNVSYNVLDSMLELFDICRLFYFYCPFSADYLSNTRLNQGM